MIGLTRFWPAVDPSEWEGDQTDLPEEIKHELANLSVSHRLKRIYASVG